MVIRNVADCVEPPKPKKYKAKYLTDKQTERLLEVAKTSDIYIPIAIGIFTGGRRGEVLGINWNNVNLEKGYINIGDNLCATKHGIIIKRPKSKDSIRKIAIPNTLVEILKMHKQEQEKNKILLGREYEDNNMVCCYPDGRYFNPKRFSTKYKEFLERNNLPVVRFHDLRHSHASLLVKLGIQPKEISARLGHSSIGITMDLYSHLYEDADTKVAEKFGELISIK